MDTSISRRVPSMASVVGTTLCVGQVVHIIWIPTRIRACLYIHMCVCNIFRYVHTHAHTHFANIYTYLCI